MPNWEYKIITSGTLGFGSLSLLEQHLNLLGKEEWEIIHFQTRPDNPLAFNGLARRPVMRDWNVETVPGPGMPSTKSGAIPAPPQERQVDAPSVEELRAEAEERRESLLSREESLRPVDGNEADDDAAAESADEFDDEENDEDLPTFFEAIRPHMRRNLRGPGMAVGIDYLAKKFEQTEADLVEALKECGFSLPASAKDEPVYLEYDGDLYWLNLNHRGQLWINTREKPRAVFRPAHGQRVAPEAPPEETSTAVEKPIVREDPRTESAPPAEAVAPAPAAIEPPAPAAVEPPAQQQPARSASPLPEGPALLDRLRPAMRRNRHGAGMSGSVTYLARAFRVEPRALVAAFEALGLVLPSRPSDKPVFVDIGPLVYWLNRDKTGQVWINTREKRDEVQPSPVVPSPEPAPIVPESVPAASEAAPVVPEAAPASPESAPTVSEAIPPAPVSVEPPAEPKPEAALAAPPAESPPAVPATGSPLAAVRLLLRETKRGGVAEELGRLADQLGQSTDNLLAALVDAGLQAPEKAREKPVFVEHAGEILWLNRNARGQLWLNAKVSKFSEKNEEEAPAEASSALDEAPAAKRPRSPRRRR
jgi:hypothetical protein